MVRGLRGLLGAWQKHQRLRKHLALGEWGIAQIHGSRPRSPKCHWDNECLSTSRRGAVRPSDLRRQLFVTSQKSGLGSDGDQRVRKRPERSTEEDKILY